MLILIQGSSTLNLHKRTIFKMPCWLSRSPFLIWTNLRIPTFRGSFFKRRALPWNEMHLEAFIEDGLQNFKCRACKGKGKKVLIMGLVPPRNPIQFQFTLSLSQNGQDMTRQQKSKPGSEMLNFFKLLS